MAHEISLTTIIKYVININIFDYPLHQFVMQRTNVTRQKLASV